MSAGGYHLPPVKEDTGPPTLSRPRLFLRFLRFGALAFGGPVAQIAMIRHELVDRERWISSDRFNRTLAVYQALPGPEAHELCVYFGHLAHGRVGGALAGLGFMLPGFVLMLALSWAYVRYGGLPWMQAVFYGVGACVIGIIANSATKLTRKSIGGDKLLWSIYLVSLLVTLLTESEEVLLFVLAGVIMWLVKAPPKSWRIKTPTAGLLPFPLLAQLSNSDPATLVNMGAFFLKAGAFVFGSGLAIVGAETEPALVLRGDQRDQGPQVPGVGGFAHEDGHPQAELLPGFLHRGAFVVRADAGGGVGVEPLAGEPGRVAVAHPVSERGELRQDGVVAVDHTREVHDLRQPQDARQRLERREVACRESGAGGLHVSGRHAGRRVHQHRERSATRVLQHESDAVQPADVGDFVRIGNDRGDPMWHDGPGELPRRHHGAFDVNVGVNEARCQKLPVEVGGLPGGVVFADAHDHAAGDRHVRRLDLAGKDVDDLRVPEQ